MGRLRLLVAVALCTCFAVANPAWSEKRVALVIGNGAYETVANLPNPPRDAKAIANLFKAAEFDEVTLKTDLGVSKMRQELRDFARRAIDADIAAVFYAGHGIELGGHNYIVPIDAKLEFDTDVEDEAVDLDHILQQLAPVKRLKLVILDACRENPFAPRMRSVTRTRDIGRGLAPPERPSANTLIAYAAALGATAADGNGANSPFTTALLKNLTRPGLDVRLALGKTHDDVLAATDNRQEPYVYTSLGGETLALAPVARLDAPPPNPTPTIEQTAFESAMRADTITALEAFLTQYPESSSTDIARRERDRLKSANTPADDEVAWDSIKLTRSRDALEKFIREFPSSNRRRDAESSLASLSPRPDGATPISPPRTEPPGKPLLDKDEVAWEKAKVARTRDSLEKFIREFPSSERRHDAELLLASLNAAPAERPKSLPPALPSIPNKPRAHPSVPVIVASPNKPAAATQGKCFQFAGERYCK